MADERLEHPLTDKFTEALTFACDLHRTQARKGTQIPYVAHLLAVAGLALEHGATENQAIAAILHDAIEDHPRGGTTSAAIRDRFGGDVLAIVEGCSDGPGNADRSAATWRPRKEAYVAHLGGAPEAVRLVSACDKLHNARALLRDYRVIGKDLWKRFHAGRDDMLWYYRALVKAFAAHGRSPVVDELERVVTELDALSADEAKAV
jgi:(p)ppGpp synthase/HD superfamily hydrolase